MPPRKQRIPLVLDTNVIIGRFLSTAPRSAIHRLFKILLVNHEFQLVLSQPVLDEYLEVMERVGVADEKIGHFRQLLLSSSLVTMINLGKRFRLDRDPDDAVFLATAQTGHARYLVTQDHDLLDIPDAERRTFCFQIVTPAGLLRRLKQ